MEHEAIAVRGEDEWDIERGRVFQALLQPVAYPMRVVLSFDEGQRDIWLVIEDIVSALGLPAADQLAAHNDATLGEADFLTDLQHLVPARFAQGRRDELSADIAFGEGALVHGFVGLAWPKGQAGSRAFQQPSLDHAIDRGRTRASGERASTAWKHYAIYR